MNDKKRGEDSGYLASKALSPAQGLGSHRWQLLEQPRRMWGEGEVVCEHRGGMVGAVSRHKLARSPATKGKKPSPGHEAHPTPTPHALKRTRNGVGCIPGA